MEVDFEWLVMLAEDQNSNSLCACPSVAGVSNAKDCPAIDEFFLEIAIFQ
jgi:hypothetical protein